VDSIKVGVGRSFEIIVTFFWITFRSKKTALVGFGRLCYFSVFILSILSTQNFDQFWLVIAVLCKK
jgi:hypothetical protein